MAVKNFHFCQADGGLISNALYGFIGFIGFIGVILLPLAQCVELSQIRPAFSEKPLLNCHGHIGASGKLTLLTCT